MNRLLQDFFLACYRATQASGILSTRFGCAAFEAAYNAYKERFEAGAVPGLRNLVTPGTTVIDVGANIGFFTTRFADWVSAGGGVIAIEPEARNLARLRAALDRSGREQVVEVLEGVASKIDGTLKLVANPNHPGDHKLGETGVPVTSWMIDSLMAERDWPEVSLIKVDVQGAEEMVLIGAEETIARFRPALFLEIDDSSLAAMGSSAKAVLMRLKTLGYSAHKLTETGAGAAIDVNLALEHLRQSDNYVDLLFLSA